MNNIFNKLEKKIIVSAQASKKEPMYEALIPVIKSVIEGGAGGLRLAGADCIREVRKFSDLPIIGITKPDPLPENWKEVVYITPTFRDAKEVAEAGADIIAIDGTSRLRSGNGSSFPQKPHPEENLGELIFKIKKELKKPVMADIATLEEGLNCASLGADIISTTLSGYTAQTLIKDNGEPDFNLLKELVLAVRDAHPTKRIPIILEGRAWTTEHVRRAFKLGAFAVVIGSAITRPHLITRRFINSL